MEGLRQVPRLRPPHAISRQAFSDGLLYLLAYVSLFRATGMWVGYPPTQDENSTVDSLPHQLVLYSIIPFTLLYIALNQRAVSGYIRRIPIGVGVFCLLVLVATLGSYDRGASVRGLSAVRCPSRMKSTRTSPRCTATCAKTSRQRVAR